MDAWINLDLDEIPDKFKVCHDVWQDGQESVSQWARISVNPMVKSQIKMASKIKHPWLGFHDAHLSDQSLQTKHEALQHIPTQGPQI